MESYGEILKKAREAKNLDLETVERETTITRQYLEALETENADAFPGEPYLVGFLHNYADYLGIDPNSVISLYKSKKLQESPVPEGLLVKQKPSYFVPLVITLGMAGVVVIALCVYFFILRRTDKDTAAALAVSKNAEKQTYTLTSAVMEKRVAKGDQIIVPQADGKIVLTVADDTQSKMGLDTPVGREYIELAEEKELDVDGDTVPDVIMYVEEVSSDTNSRGALVRMCLRDASATTAVAENAVTEPVAAVAQPDAKSVVVLEDNRAYPFTINASFRGSCLFRSAVDSDASEEDFFTNGDIVTKTANNKIRVWMSNCNTVKIQVIADSKTYSLDVGKAGQVVVEDIKWIKDSSGSYKLVVTDID